MIINHNLMANNALRNMNINSNAAAKSMQKLSSGLRINGAADDAAGLAISEKMRGQINGLDQASSNSQDGISLVQTAEGALNETTSILQRMRTLAVQGATDTNTSTDRTNIQDEMDQLTKEIDRIANTTQFNTKNLLDGSMGSTVSTAVANIDTNKSLLSSAGAAITSATTLVGLENAASSNLGIAVGDTVTVSYVENGTQFTKDIAVATATTLGDLSTGNVTLTVATGTATGAIDADAATAGFAGGIYGLTFTVKDSAGTVKTAATNALSAFSETTSAQDKRLDGSATFQIGANEGQTMNLSLDTFAVA
ncbi:MAG: flagellin [Clostridiales bacterium]|nr:flagellin [Clostridiales bacterium]